MRCPFCRSDDSKVVDSRTVEDGVRRRRECLACAARFTTYERTETAAVLVVKRDGRREAFAREKLLAGVRRACEKRPLAADAVEGLVSTVEDAVQARGLAEVPSTAIGELVMSGLKVLDGIAYVRFASVYRSFADVESLREIVEELEAGRMDTDPGGQGSTPRAALVAAEPPRGGPPRRPRWRGSGERREPGGMSEDGDNGVKVGSGVAV